MTANKPRRSTPPTAKEATNLAEKAVTGFIIIVIVFAAFALLFTAKSLFFPALAVSAVTADPQQQSGHFGAGGLTEFDLELAQKIMDKDGDGKCDVCGMDIDFCIESGQLQCNMGGKTGKLDIGVLDKTKQKHHFHADLKIHIDGKEIDLNQEKYFVKSRFMHVENDIQGDSGEVLHMHATGVPLWLFFESVGMKFTDGCFIVDTGEKYCNDSRNTLKLYVNGRANKEFGDYVFQDDDRILISYGPNSEDIKSQMEGPSFAQNH